MAFWFSRKLNPFVVFMNMMPIADKELLIGYQKVSAADRPEDELC